MAPEKTKTLTLSQRNTEAIIAHLGEYISIRFDHAIRINPALKSLKQDLMYHEMANVRHCLNGDKIYGPTRLIVSDVILSDNRKRREGIMSPTDQTSIQVELVSHCQDERVEATRGQIRIHDLKSFYASINPALSDTLDLVESWIWWDIFDACALVRFEQKMGVVTTIRQGRFTPEMRKRYLTTLQSALGEEEVSAGMSNEDIVRYELKQIMDIRDRWAGRRHHERGHMYVLKRDELTPPPQGELIHQVAEEVRQYDQFENKEDISEEDKHRFAPDLRLPPDKVTRQHVLDYLQQQLIDTERTMLRQAEHDSELGQPYNYKERQLEQMDKTLQVVVKQIRGGAPQAQPANPAAS